MIGGDREVFSACEAMFADVALPDGYRFFDGHGAGHFVKMVHNGIEYGMMQAIAEGFALMHDGPFELDLEEVAAVYQHGSVVESRLVGWLGGAYAELGSDLEGVSGVVGHTGEGAWTVDTAKELDIPTPVIEGLAALPRGVRGQARATRGRCSRRCATRSAATGSGRAADRGGRAAYSSAFALHSAINSSAR